MEPTDANYDEDQVPAYTLPDPLVMANGEPIADAATWTQKRRPEILQLFKTHVYGEMPGPLADARWEITEEGQALAARARRRQIRVHFAADGPCMDILLYIPAGTQGPVRTFLGLNFFGNHTVLRDPNIHLNPNWMRPERKNGIVDNRATPDSRGCLSHRWPVADIIARGYALATVYSGDLDPDYDDGYHNGVHPLFYKEGQTRPGPDQWGTIGAWAWGLSRAMDYLQSDADIGDVAVLGLSRLGKTSLWAGACDPRFALVISNESGCGGAALSRRCYGETIRHINESFPHWFCDNFRRYNDAEDDLPLDQHLLLALIAPRPLYVASAVEDRWCDPRGEFLAARAADPVYRLLGCEGLPADEMPAIDQPVQGRIGYHIRSGGHDLTAYDWAQYLDFADLHLRERPMPTGRDFPTADGESGLEPAL